ncbi:DNA polymerase-4 [Microbacterium endophyticum]|uniref:DNA polymerase IV n=1 Tax=Microbacterium endophyticum TaxID=1526412 RepID=A0A7W4V0F7_9MICO|nr:DNA polymerase IV [Microbacterium endophyticum]MBB2974593.1 DNA polymerase-4 [Microbacterium endophyticum]NIK36890.1 DNA polymerase-4 [Microbacterium endophyticum]
MGKGDGRGRLTSPPDVDDTGAHVLHVDMDAFYPSVEILDNPSLRGKPIIIGSTEGRSVVSSASYEARVYGVRSAMPVSQALRLCPKAIVVPPHFARYSELSRQVMAVFHEVTPLVEPLSIDEAFLDVSGSRRLWGRPREIAQMLRARVHERTGLTCSVGAAATKHVAKMASTLSKPDGLLVVSAASTADFLSPLSVRNLWGVGPKSADVLEARGIRVVADVLTTPIEVLQRALGVSMGERVWQLARGIDTRTVQTERVEKSVGHEETFEVDVTDPDALRAELRRLADRVGVRLRRHEWSAQTVSIKIRFADFTTVTRGLTLAEPSNVSQRLGDVALDLFAQLHRGQPVRLVGVRAENLRPASVQGGGLWDDDAEWRRVDGALDGAATRFGVGAITRAALLGGRKSGSSLPSHPRPDADFS